VGRIFVQTVIFGASDRSQRSNHVFRTLPLCTIWFEMCRRSWWFWGDANVPAELTITSTTTVLVGANMNVQLFLDKYVANRPSLIRVTLKQVLSAFFGNNVEPVFREISSFRQSGNKLSMFILFRIGRKDEISRKTRSTLLPKTVTMSKQRSTLSKESFDF